MYNEIMKEINIMEAALKQLGERGKTLAYAEQDYKIALATEMLQLKAKGERATIMRDLCYGTPHIAKLRLARDIAEVMYKSASEAIQVKKYKVKIMENQYDKEYGARNVGVGQ